MRSLLLLPASLVWTIAQAALSPEDALLPSSQLAAQAQVLLSTGTSLSRVVDIYDHILSRDAGDYLTLFKRATAYLALSQSKRAADDFEAVLRLNGEFEQARINLARLRLKTGDVSAAETVLKGGPAKAKDAQSIKDIQASGKLLLEQSKKARAASKKGDWQNCIDSATQAINIATQSFELQQLKAECSLESGNLEDAAGDYSRAAALNPSSVNLLTRLALLNYVFLFADSSVSLAPIKQCLHYDPDSKPCKQLFRKLKAIDKDIAKARNFVEGSKWLSAALAIDPRSSATNAEDGLIPRVKALITEATAKNTGHLPSTLKLAQSRLLTTLYSWACQAHLRSSATSRASTTCGVLRTLDAEDTFAKWSLGIDLMQAEDWAKAVQVLQQAFENSGRQDRDIHEALQKAQGGLKRSKSKDYYKVLGVAHDADSRTIKRAYRKATLKAHPDKGGSEAAMAAVNEAYEVLSNPDLRARFDRGDDPNDSSGQQTHYSQQFNPHAQQFFQQFFQQQSGGRPSFLGFQSIADIEQNNSEEVAVSNFHNLLRQYTSQNIQKSQQAQMAKPAIHPELIDHPRIQSPFDHFQFSTPRRPATTNLMDTGILTPPQTPNLETLHFGQGKLFETVKVPVLNDFLPPTPPVSAQKAPIKVVTPLSTSFTPLRTGTTTSSRIPLRFQTIPSVNVVTKRYIRVTGVRQDLSPLTLREIILSYGAVAFAVTDRLFSNGEIQLAFHDYRTALTAWPKLRTDERLRQQSDFGDSTPLLELEWLSRSQVSAPQSSLSISEGAVVVKCLPSVPYSQLWKAIADIADVRAIAQVEIGSLFVAELCDDRLTQKVIDELDGRIVAGHRLQVDFLNLDLALDYQNTLQNKSNGLSGDCQPLTPPTCFKIGDPIKPSSSQQTTQTSSLSANARPFKKISKRNLPPVGFSDELENDPFAKVQGENRDPIKPASQSIPVLPFNKVDSPNSVFVGESSPSALFGQYRAPHLEKRENLINLDAIRTGYETRKVLMLGNIPQQLSRDMIRERLEAAGLSGCFDFLYLRSNFTSRKVMAYGFISFTSSEHIITLFQAMANTLWHEDSNKLFQASFADYQSLDGYIAKFRNSAVMTEAEHMRPQLFHTTGPLRGQVRPFPPPNNAERVLSGLEQKRIGLHQRRVRVNTEVRLFSRVI